MENTYLYHSGVKGMRWGVRRYQNKDGSLTPAGRKRYAKSGTSNAKGKSTDKPKAVVKGKTSAAENKPKELTVEEKKARVLASRSAKEVYENRKLFDYKEMENAYNILLKDKQVRDLIVTEPNKVEKFVDQTVIPWANRIKNIATPVADTLKKIDEVTKLFGGDESDHPATAKKTSGSGKSKTDETDKADNTKSDKTDKVVNTKSDKTDKVDAPDISKTDKSKTNKPDTTKTEKIDKPKVEVLDKPKATKDDSVSGEWLGKNTRSEVTTTKSSNESRTTYYDIDYVDHTPSRQTTSFVASLSSSSVPALPAPSSQAVSFVAGLLPAPKED